MNILIELLGTGVSLLRRFPRHQARRHRLGEVHRQQAAQGPRRGRSHDAAFGPDLALISASVGAIIQVLANRGTQRAITRFAKTQDIV